MIPHIIYYTYITLQTTNTLLYQIDTSCKTRQCQLNAWMFAQVYFTKKHFLTNQNFSLILQLPNCMKHLISNILKLL